MLGLPMGGAYSYRDILALFKTMQRKQKLVSALGIQKENWRQSGVCQRYLSFNFEKNFLQILLINCLAKCVVTPSFLFAFQLLWLRSAFPVYS